jgi:hypothetical protein
MGKKNDTRPDAAARGHRKETRSVGIVDRIKEGAEKVSEGRPSSKSARRDAAAQKLGYLVYREKTQGTPGGTEVDALVAEISSLDEDLETHTADLPEGAAVSGDPDGQTTGSTASEDTPPAAGGSPVEAAGEPQQTERSDK